MNIRLEAASFVFCGDTKDIEKAVEIIEDMNENEIVHNYFKVWELFENKNVKYIKEQIDNIEDKLDEIYQKGFSHGLAKSPSVEKEFAND